MTIDEVFSPISPLKRWVPYKLVYNTKRGKHDKVPNNGRHGLSTTDPMDWRPLLEAIKIAKEGFGLSGVGFVMTDGIEVDGLTLVGFDFDDVDEEFTVPFETYTEWSPSKKGVRAFAWAPTEWCKKYQDSTNPKPPHCDHAEIYIGTAPRFLTVTFDTIQMLEFKQLTPADLKAIVSWGMKAYQEKVEAPVISDTAGTPIDLTRVILTDDQKKLVSGEPVEDKSKTAQGLIIRLMDNDKSNEDILATLIKEEHLLAYLLSHRSDDPDKALQFAADEISSAYPYSIRGKREKLVSYNEGWADKTDAPDTPEADEVDTTYQWEIDHAPAAYAAYVEWYMQNARILHLGYAMQSADLFFQGCCGWNIKSPSGLRANKWSLTLAASAGGKDAIQDLACEAMRQLNAKRIFPAIPMLEDSFASGPAMWGHLMQVHQMIWFHPELASQLTQLSKAEQGVLFEKRETLLKLSDSSKKPHIPPPRYALSTQGKYKLQPINYGFFSSIGTGVLGDIRAFTDGSLKSGLLNRYEVDVISGQVMIGNSGGYSPIPDAIEQWAKHTFMRSQDSAMKQNNLSALGKAIEFKTYPEFDADWRTAMQFDLTGCEKNAGIYGRSAEKMVKRALIHAFAGCSDITQASFEWGEHCVKARIDRFKNHFEIHGGGAKSPEDALCRAFMRAFSAPKLAKQHARDGYLKSGDFRRSGGVAWVDSRDGVKEERALIWLKDNHFIEELGKDEKAAKGLRADARAFRKLRDYD
ncbi:hypothetical protein QFA96_12225 [Pseudomonas sp. Ap32]|nr:hypothetical protein QFA96_12225 [Pseudomonas sp. Ap32]